MSARRRWSAAVARGSLRGPLQLNHHSLDSVLRPFLTALLVLAAVLPAERAHAQTRGDGADLAVHLLTMGQGDLVWEKFGHNAIWIHDPVARTDRVYNFGVFDFDSPGYWGRFMKGDWIYQLAVYGINETLAQYRYFDRTVVAQELNLTGAEKAELRELLEINALPQNREYLYDYYGDNCSTRVRDVLNRVLGGAISAQTAGVATGTTYRWHSRRLIASDRLAYTGLAAGLGPPADREIDAWEEMFLPQKLMERAREITVDRGGRAEPLVVSEHVLYEATGREPEREEPPSWLVWYVLIGIGFGAVLVGLATAERRGYRSARFAFAALGSLWSILIGSGGLILVGLWAFTNHDIAHANENIFHFTPLAVPLVLLVPALAYGARWARRPARWTAFAVAAMSLLGFVLQVLPGLDQVNGEVIGLLLPVHLALAYAVNQLS